MLDMTETGRLGKRPWFDGPVLVCGEFKAGVNLHGEERDVGLHFSRLSWRSRVPLASGKEWRERGVGDMGIWGYGDMGIWGYGNMRNPYRGQTSPPR